MGQAEHPSMPNLVKDIPRACVQHSPSELVRTKDSVHLVLFRKQFTNPDCWELGTEQNKNQPV